MPRSKIFLPDINVWIAAAAGKHVHHTTAKEWFGRVESGGAAFCRITQMGFLRLVTNSRVMQEDVLDQNQAWDAYEKIARDRRVIYVSEPENLQATWKLLTQSSMAGANLWTDAYLAAFATLQGMTLVSFDRGFRNQHNLDCVVLPEALRS